MRYTIKHEIDADVSAFWKVYFDPDFNRAMLGKLGSYEVLESRLDERGTLHRRVTYGAKVELPALAKRLLGDGLCLEVGQYDAASSVYAAEQMPTRGKGFSYRFEVTVNPLSARRCERIIVSEVSVNAFGVGTLIESAIRRSQEQVHQRAAAMIADWVREHGM
jgi:hypothetical protein